MFVDLTAFQGLFPTSNVMGFLKYALPAIIYSTTVLMHHELHAM